MISKKITIYSILFVTISAILIFILKHEKTPSNNNNNYNLEKNNYLANSSENDINENQINENVDIEYLLELFKKRYSNNLNSMRSKIRLLGGMIRHFKKIYPNYWREQLIDTITNEFPDHANELIKYLDKTEEYYSFINSNNNLKELSFEEKREKIWEKRKEIFGEDYRDIWASEIKKKQLNDLAVTLDKQANLDLNQKLYTYKNTINDLYNSEKNNSIDSEDIKIQKMKLANRFLSMDSIQNELDEMTTETRREKLRNIRIEMGLDSDTVKQLEEVDKRRERLWKSGTAYSAIRDYIISKFNGTTRKDKLDEARKKHFGDLADVIKKEEETFKYYRFNNPQKWGVDY